MNIGVDFGTAYSQIAYRYNGVTEVVEKPGLYGIDSLFYYDKEQAQAQKEKYEKAIKQDIKNDAKKLGIEKTDEEINKEAEAIIDKLEKWCFGVVGNPAYSCVRNEDQFYNLVSNVKLGIGKTYELDGEKFTSEEIIKSIYREVIHNFGRRAIKEKVPDFTIDGIVLTHPAEFEMEKINEITRAAKNCVCDGKPLNIIGTIKEPVAAAIAYYEGCPDLPDGTGILVYDLGSGTCDVSIVKKQKDLDQEFEVIDFGTVNVGGLAWDDIIYDYIAYEIVEKYPDNIDYILNNEDNIFEFTRKAQEIKKDLSENALVNKGIVVKISDCQKELVLVTITRSKFDDLSQTVRNTTMNLLETIYAMRCDSVDIKEIILVGGASQMPQIKESIEQKFKGKRVKVKSYDPAYAVCKGAAIYADKVMNKLEEKFTKEEIEKKIEENNSGENSTSGNIAVLLYEDGKSKGLVTDAIPFSYGVKYNFSGKTYVKNLITRGQKFPAVGVCSNFIPDTEATLVNIEIYESSNCDSSYCYNGERLVGYVNLEVPEGINRSDKIECKINILSLDAVEIVAKGKGKNVTGKFELIKRNEQNN